MATEPFLLASSITSPTTFVAKFYAMNILGTYAHRKRQTDTDTNRDRQTERRRRERRGEKEKERKIVSKNAGTKAFA